ncbi:MAG: class 3 adenylate cyclase [Cellvibrionaceae bacterium]|jgi:class 3 adenylate cyclase
MISNIENLTIMFTDIVGFSKIVSSSSRMESEALIKQHDKIVETTIKRFGGRKIKSIGDSFLSTFRSPTDAVLCSMAIQDSLWEYNQTDGVTQKIIVRIALNAGEVRLSFNDIFGEAVNIAARLENQTPAGAILLTESVYLSMNKNEINLEALGPFEFKGIPQSINVYRAHAKKAHSNDATFAHYPYDGAHQRLKPAGRVGNTFGRVFVGISASLLAAFVSWWVTIHYMSGIHPSESDKIAVEFHSISTKKIIDKEDGLNLVDIDTDVSANNAINDDPTFTIIAETTPLLLEQNYIVLTNKVREFSKKYADNSYLQMLKGHIAVYAEDYKQAIEHYQNALEKESTLANETLLSSNLILLMEHQRPAANKLIASYFSQALRDELAKRSGQAGLRTRYDAFYLLIDSGNADKIDRVGLNLWDLKELEKCQYKKVAIVELNRLNDPTALAGLKEASKMGFFERIKYNCMRQDLKQTIKKLEAKKAEKSS